MNYILNLKLFLQLIILSVTICSCGQPSSPVETIGEQKRQNISELPTEDNSNTSPTEDNSNNGNITLKQAYEQNLEYTENYRNDLLEEAFLIYESETFANLFEFEIEAFKAVSEVIEDYGSFENVDEYDQKVDDALLEYEYNIDDFLNY